MYINLYPITSLNSLISTSSLFVDAIDIHLLIKIVIGLPFQSGYPLHPFPLFIALARASSTILSGSQDIFFFLLILGLSALSMMLAVEFSDTLYWLRKSPSLFLRGCLLINGCQMSNTYFLDARYKLSHQVLHIFLFLKIFLIFGILSFGKCYSFGVFL